MNSNEKNEATLDKFRRGWEEELKNNSPNSSTSSEMEKRVGSFYFTLFIFTIYFNPLVGV